MLKKDDKVMPVKQHHNQVETKSLLLSEKFAVQETWPNWLKSYLALNIVVSPGFQRPPCKLA
jgi:hypothetical protein